MCEIENFFEQALAEVGVDATVFRQNDHDSFSESFFVTKRLGDESLSYKVDIDKTGLDLHGERDVLRSIIAQRAREVKKAFDEELSEKILVNECSIIISPYNGGWAECRRCGERIEGELRRSGSIHMAEQSFPQPDYSFDRKPLENPAKSTRLLLRLYLVGKLRRACPPNCPNSIQYTERFK